MSLQDGGEASNGVEASSREQNPDAEDKERRERGREEALGMLLPFQRALITDLLREDGLCILAPGIGLHQIVAVLLRLQDLRLREPSQRGVVLVLGAAPWQRDMLRRELARVDPPGPHTAAEAPLLHPREVTNEVPAAERTDLYRSHPVLFVTTRILVVDLLSRRLGPQEVAGLVVLNAHRVSDSSGEGFATRLFKGGHPEGFVRGFSDTPAGFTSEFNKVEKVMKALHVRRLHLWPRFQATVKSDLEAQPPELVELSLGMSGAMGLVYDALTELMDACVKELRRSNKLDTTDLTVDQGLLKSFDEVVRRQLNTIWHTVSPKTKQIVADLRTLRTLGGFLLCFDPLTFLSYLDNLRATEGTKSVWLFHSAAHTIFEASKSRVYRLRPAGAAAASRKRKAGGGATADEEETGAAGAGGAGAMVIDPVLEPLPKWDLLVEVMEEIQKERAALAAAGTGEGEGGERGHNGRDQGVGPGEGSPQEGFPVLVVCQDAFTCGQLRQVLRPEGPAGLLQRLYRDYLQYKMEGGAAGKSNKPLREPERGGARHGGGVGPSRLMGGYRPGEEVALLREAKALTAPSPATSAPPPPARTSGRGRGRGRKGGGRGAGRREGAGSSAGGGAAAAAARARAMATAPGRRNLESPPPQPPRSRAEEGNSQGGEMGLGGGDGGDVSPSSPPTAGGPLLEGVHFLCLESHDVMQLWAVRPAFVVMYDPDVAFTRQLELFKAQSSEGLPLRVYLLRYEDSMEMDRYQAAVTRERGVFEQLIKAKEIMTLPAAPTQQVDPSRRLPAVHSDLQQLGIGGNALTRRAGGRLTGRSLPRRIVVDVREFMSSLPAVLHQQGLDLVPLTLEVGDYVLSPELCVERKSIADLRGSLQSGRLYHQAEAMTRHYKTPVLLIEFEGDKAFALQASSEIADDIQLHSMMSKLALLCLHFPKLRLIWSRSLHATADMFQTLKANHEEPDPLVAAGVGVGEEGGGQGGESVVNQSAIDLLRRLPGVMESNWRGIMRHVSSLAELADTPLDTLAEIMGGQIAARKLRDFLDQECKALFHAL